MKVMSVVGARPNFMKVAPIITAIRDHNDSVPCGTSHGSAVAGTGHIHHVLVHTGQHYDRLMSDSFFSDLNLPAPDVHLGVGSGSHAEQTAEIMRKFEKVLCVEKPDVLVVVGDVNSTLACALVAAKISFDASGRRPLIAHVEAGLRSCDRSMPEEVNRALTDQLSDLLFATEESGLQNLAREGVPPDKVHFVGNTMIDSLLTYKGKAEGSRVLEDLNLRTSGRGTQPYALLTLHRPANVDSGDAFLDILEGLQELIGEYRIIFPAHPRTQKNISGLGLEQYFDLRYVQDETEGPTTLNKDGAIEMIAPLGYIDFLHLMKNAALVITDSGGIQEETTCLGVPCVTVRENTERPVTIRSGTNVLAGVKREGIRRAIRQQLMSKPSGVIPEKWDGKSANRILAVISSEFQKRVLPSLGPNAQ
jgi:UDP-N-acetylglucosamine 2-epimerase (non-hydrolysing)